MKIIKTTNYNNNKKKINNKIKINTIVCKKSIATQLSARLVKHQGCCLLPGPRRVKLLVRTNKTT